MLNPADKAPSDSLRRLRRVSKHASAEKTRQYIVQAASELSDKGRNITVSSLARTAGISRATFYTHFAGLEELAVYMHQQGLREVTRWQHTMLQANPPWSEPDAQRESFRRFAAAFAKKRQLYSTIFNLPEAAGVRQRAAQSITEALYERVVSNNIQAPQGIDTEFLLSALAAAYMQILTLWVTRDSNLESEQIGDYMYELMPQWLRDPGGLDS
ncbi:TetR/AcrR family transcriptional regulator [Enteractinococcus helveticum]|nr:TetR/AcrR family transcriptional regulator [Enteractinococcus helveticum]